MAELGFEPAESPLLRLLLCFHILCDLCLIFLFTCNSWSWYHVPIWPELSTIKLFLLLTWPLLSLSSRLTIWYIYVNHLIHLAHIKFIFNTKPQLFFFTRTVLKSQITWKRRVREFISPNHCWFSTQDPFFPSFLLPKRSLTLFRYPPLLQEVCESQGMLTLLAIPGMAQFV